MTKIKQVMVICYSFSRGITMVFQVHKYSIANKCLYDLYVRLCASTFIHIYYRTKDILMRRKTSRCILSDLTFMISVNLLQGADGKYGCPPYEMPSVITCHSTSQYKFKSDFEIIITYTQYIYSHFNSYTYS